LISAAAPHTPQRRVHAMPEEAPGAFAKPAQRHRVASAKKVGWQLLDVKKGRRYDHTLDERHPFRFD